MGVVTNPTFEVTFVKILVVQKKESSAENSYQSDYFICLLLLQLIDITLQWLHGDGGYWVWHILSE